MGTHEYTEDLCGRVGDCFEQLKALCCEAVEAVPLSVAEENRKLKAEVELLRRDYLNADRKAAENAQEAGEAQAEMEKMRSERDELVELLYNFAKGEVDDNHLIDFVRAKLEDI